jgi:hypothetical protein
MANSIPPIRAFFNGLLVMKIDDYKNVCEVGVHNRDAAHYLSIVVVEKRSGAPDVNLWRHQGALPDNLWIDVLNTNRRVEPKFEGDVLDRNPRDDNQRQDIRWAVDLSGKNFHKQVLDIDYAGLRHGICLTHGKFYTAMRTQRSIVSSVRRVDGGEPPLELYRVATVIGAEMRLDQSNSYAILQFEKGDKPLLELKPQRGVSYEIYVENSPLLVSEQPEGDFKKYYQVINGIPSVRRFNLEYHTVPRVSQDVPCLPVILGHDT